VALIDDSLDDDVQLLFVNLLEYIEPDMRRLILGKFL
jgi:hypothetical protein